MTTRPLDTRQSALAAGNDARVAELLIRRSMTLDEVSTATGLSCRVIRRDVFPRLRARGLPVEIVDVFKTSNDRGGASAFWRIVLPRGRVCAHDGCGTVLRSTNPSDRCELHGGGCVDFGEVEYVPTVTRVRTCKGYGRRPHRTDDWSNGTHLCRSCYRVYRREYNRKRAAMRGVAS